MAIPLILRLKKERHKEIARAQDLIVESLYEVFNNAVLHGGTAIWRCYSGNRFSEDVDVYIQKDIKKIEELFSNLEKKGFIIEKKKISDNSLYSNLRFNNIFVRLEALFKKISGILKEYETIDGNFMSVYSLSAEEIINEKISAYLKRLKIRDLYDIFFLIKHVRNKSAVNIHLRRFLKEFKEPVDENEFGDLVLSGLIPEKNKMIDYIKSFVR